MNLEQMEEARSNRIKRESQSEVLQKRKEARDAIELKKIDASIITDKDYFERMFKEVSAA
jgi:tRNA 2-selenouridine synthase SelU